MTSTETITATETGTAVTPADATPVPAKSTKKPGARAKTSGTKRKKSSGKVTRTKAKKAPKTGDTAAKADSKRGSKPRPESKGGTILLLIARAKGATLAEIMKETGWQAHSVRGFLSTAAKKHGLTIDSHKSEDGQRVYKSSK